MITLDMTKKHIDVAITEQSFVLESGILTLQISLGAYDLSGKTITAGFSITELETGALAVADGVIQLPIYYGLLAFGTNYIQLNIRQGTTLEQSPRMVLFVRNGVQTTPPTAEDATLVTYLVNLCVTATAAAEAVVADFEEDMGEGHLLQETLQQSIADGNLINGTLTVTTIPSAQLINSTLTDTTIPNANSINTTLTNTTIPNAQSINTTLTNTTIPNAQSINTTLSVTTTPAAVSINNTLTNTTIPAATAAEESLQTLVDNSQIGSLDDLHTNDKATLVGSINEIYEMQIPSAKRYGVRWNKTLAACTRLYDAAAITTNTTNFGHFGSVNASYNNPFDSLYPWRDRKLVNVNVTAYRAAIAAGTDVFASIVSWEGDPDFKLDGTNGFVGVYTPEFWFKIDNTSTYVDYIISDMPLPGYTKFKATVGGRWHGVADGTGITSKPGMPIANETMAAMHTRATLVDMTLDDIWSYSATSLLATVEYATLNHQTAIGKGVDSVYFQGIRPYIEETDVTRVVMADSQAAVFFAGVIIDIGTSNGGAQVARRIVTSVEVHSAGYKSVNFDGTPISTLSAHYVSAHGVSNLATPEILSTSGYIGTNGKVNAFYRGQVHHANLWRYCLGAYRETLTSKIWTAVDPAGAAAVDALNTGVHRDIGLVLPTGADGAALSDYLGGLHQWEIPLAPFGSAVGGTGANPVGDYLYVPSLATGNTVLLVGGYAYYGLFAGRFYGYWGSGAGDSYWYIGALPFLKT